MYEKSKHYITKSLNTLEHGVSDFHCWLLGRNANLLRDQEPGQVTPRQVRSLQHHKQLHEQITRSAKQKATRLTRKYSNEVLSRKRARKKVRYAHRERRDFNKALAEAEKRAQDSQRCEHLYCLGIINQRTPGHQKDEAYREISRSPFETLMSGADSTRTGLESSENGNEEPMPQIGQLRMSIEDERSSCDLSPNQCKDVWRLRQVIVHKNCQVPKMARELYRYMAKEGHLASPQGVVEQFRLLAHDRQARRHCRCWNHRVIRSAGNAELFDEEGSSTGGRSKHETYRTPIPSQPIFTFNPPTKPKILLKLEAELKSSYIAYTARDASLRARFAARLHEQAHALPPSMLSEDGLLGNRIHGLFSALLLCSFNRTHLVSSESRQNCLQSRCRIQLAVIPRRYQDHRFR